MQPSCLGNSLKSGGNMGNCRYIRNLLNRVNRRGLYPLGTEGARWRRRLCKRVMFAVAQGGGSEKVLKIDQPSAGGFLVLTALGAEGCGIAIGHACGVRVQRVQKVHRVQRVWYRPAGDEYKVSVTGLPSRPHRHSDPGRRILVHVDSDTY